MKADPYYGDLSFLCGVLTVLLFWFAYTQTSHVHKPCAACTTRK